MAERTSNISKITWLGSDQRLARNLGRPINRFFHVEAAGGIVLLVATAIALIWANSPWSDSYHELWESQIELHIGDIDVFAKAGLEHFTLEEFVNDALMAIFFFVVGLEIKRELVTGQLRNRRDAALPAIAALGGMVVPAALFAIVNAGGDGSAGWGIPMATDIAFAVGVVSLLGDRIPRSLRVFLLSLAIVDDIGAILVIAVFYTNELSIEWLVTALALAAVTYAMREARIWYIPLYVVVGAFFWWATFKSGVHATIAGVTLGLITPARPIQTDEQAREVATWLRDKGEVFTADVRFAAFHLRESVSVAERLETAIHPISSYLIIPIFALANAGIELSTDSLSDATGSAVTFGVILGLVFGKTIGVTLFSYIGVRSGIAALPRGVTWRHLTGLAMLAGIGFTVSIFVSGLAYDDPLLDDQAKIGILVASAIAAIAGTAILSGAARAGSHSTD
ncbi:MAG: Na+/H+ antiporter NhaA [Acidimicrobiia bacterium]|nr:Na+/H+ antiporter NhaA [Acidimicrobiia bacterium]